MAEEQEVQAPTEAPAEAPTIAEEVIPGTSLLSDADPADAEKTIPDWFAANKFKSLEDQARAYAELEKRAGAFSGAPDEDYVVPQVEGLDEGVMDNNPMVMWFKQVARDTNLNQETFDRIISGYLATEQEMITYSRENEMVALGDNAKNRLTNLGDWGQANLSAEQWEIFKSVASTAVGVDLLESMIGKTREAKLARDPDAQAAGAANTAEELRQMRYAKNENGQLRMAVEPGYKKQVDAAYAELYGGADPFPA